MTSCIDLAHGSFECVDLHSYAVVGQFDRKDRDRLSPATAPPKARPNTIGENHAAVLVITSPEGIEDDPDNHP